MIPNSSMVQRFIDRGWEFGAQTETPDGAQLMMTLVSPVDDCELYLAWIRRADTGKLQMQKPTAYLAGYETAEVAWSILSVGSLVEPSGVSEMLRKRLKRVPSAA